MGKGQTRYVSASSMRAKAVLPDPAGGKDTAGRKDTTGGNDTSSVSAGEAPAKFARGFRVSFSLLCALLTRDGNNRDTLHGSGNAKQKSHLRTPATPTSKAPGTSSSSRYFSLLDAMRMISR
ncbi:hypothetical protein K503DRAFT_78083 [Rhizopogon vinicolor AM-OR11-026]|uniref:Uncharacterized protein n=1 Tax=Rhizopogon vinicolor AM-OR11-026 TaxID=1314800 RepID=A0A1B7MFZ8_9AGAM|nr:hypothetical protein K503DRAFT_78083 [Rhizopogon vinicolor AM-OR11-026]